jgi:hypothetical protein
MCPTNAPIPPPPPPSHQLQPESVSSKSQVKTSIIRGIKKRIVEQYPSLEEVIDEIIPKKESSIFIAKWYSLLLSLLRSSLIE